MCDKFTIEAVKAVMLAGKVPGVPTLNAASSPGDKPAIEQKPTHSAPLPCP